MNARLAAVLLVLLAVLGGGAVLVYQQRGAQQPEAAGELGRPVLPALQAADIATIVIREAGDTLTLQRREASWAIVERAGFPADLEQVRRLVLSVLGLKVGQTEGIGDKDRARLKLDASGTRLEFRGADGSALATLVVGKKYFKREPRNPEREAGDGRFVLLPEAPGTVYVVADPLPLATAASAPWVAKTGFGAEKVRSMEVTYPGGAKWRIARAREDADWKLTPLYAGERLDVIRANSGFLLAESRGDRRRRKARPAHGSDRPRQARYRGRLDVRRPQLHAEARQGARRGPLRDAVDLGRAEGLGRRCRRARQAARRAPAPRAGARRAGAAHRAREVRGRSQEARGTAGAQGPRQEVAAAVAHAAPPEVALALEEGSWASTPSST
jgi:hypothetical protein